jgi:hypothetical protein
VDYSRLGEVNSLLNVNQTSGSSPGLPLVLRKKKNIAKDKKVIPDPIDDRKARDKPKRHAILNVTKDYFIFYPHNIYISQVMCWRCCKKETK